MPDPRFFQDRGPASLESLAALTGSALPDASVGARLIQRVAPLGRAGPDDLSFFFDPRYAADLATTKAGAVFVPRAMVDRLPMGCIGLITAEPQMAYAHVAAKLHPVHGFDPTAPLIHPGAELEDDVDTAPGVVIGPGARVGRGTRIGANAVIGPGVEIGRHGQIGPGVCIGFALIGDRVRILAGASIGEAGFGITGGRTGMFDIPQLGRVIIQDGVTVGANSCIDRGAFEDTVIGEDTKIDNLVQIGHNVRIGRGCLFASQVGISGSTVIGDGVRFGGQAGVADHLKIGNGAALLARAGLMNDIPDGEVWGGYPAVPRRQWLRQSIWVSNGAAKKPRGEGEPKA